MTEEQTQQIRALVREKRYNEAHAILVRLDDDPAARQMLETLEDFIARETPDPVKIRLGQGRYYLDNRHLTLYLVVGGVLFLVFRSPVPGILFYIYDRQYGVRRNMDAHRIIIGLIVAVGLSFGLYVILTVLSASQQVR